MATIHSAASVSFCMLGVEEIVEKALRKSTLQLWAGMRRSMGEAKSKAKHSKGDVVNQVT